MRIISRNLYRHMVSGFAIIGLMIVGAVISLPIIYCQMMDKAWINISDDYKSHGQFQAHPGMPVESTYYGGFDIYRISFAQNGKQHVIDLAPVPDGMALPATINYDVDHINELTCFANAVALLMSRLSAPIAITGILDGERTTFTLDATRIYHDLLDYWKIILLVGFFGLLLTATTGFFVIRRAERRPITELIKTIQLMADDPTVTQPFPDSIKNIRDFDELVQAVELLQLNMMRTLQHRERLAEIGEGVAKINHDIRNVLSSATLVSDALLASKDENVRRSAPLVLRSLEQAVDLCQSMLDYLAHAPTPVHADFDLVTMFEEVKAATLLDINYCGPATMHADRGMMFRIMLNLGRNAGTAGASALSIDIWRAGHLAIMDISDNGSGIPRHLWPSLFSPFKSRQSTSGGLGLSIARDLALAQDGILKLSRSSDVGSEFRIQFSCVRFPEMAHEGASTNWPSVPIGSHTRTAHQPS